MAECIAVVNAGSSSVKFAFYDSEGDQPLLLKGQVEQIGVAPSLSASNPEGEEVASLSWPAEGFGHAQAMGAILEVAREQLAGSTVKGVGHRVVHGGTHFAGRSR
jgi:acetate kinase